MVLKAFLGEGISDQLGKGRLGMILKAPQKRQDLCCTALLLFV